jgi:hypothetical protein
MSGRGDGARNGVRNVVEFEVEEYSETKRRQLLDCLGSFCGKELASYLENACGPSKLPRQSRCLPGAVNIQGDD